MSQQSQVALVEAVQIVSEVLVAFGAGYTARRCEEMRLANPAAPINMPALSSAPIWADHGEFMEFYEFLVGATVKSILQKKGSLHKWVKTSRPQISIIAFTHGSLARDWVTTNSKPALSAAGALATLPAAKALCAGNGPGSGWVCDF